MLPEAALVSHLTGQTESDQMTVRQRAGVMDLLLSVENRVLPQYAPEATRYPRIIYRVIVDPATHTMVQDGELRAPTIQIACQSERYAQAKEVAQDALAALQDFSGRMGGVHGLNVERVLVEDFGRDFYYQNAAGGIHEIQFDIRIIL